MHKSSFLKTGQAAQGVQELHFSPPKPNALGIVEPQLEI